MCGVTVCARRKSQQECIPFYINPKTSGARAFSSSVFQIRNHSTPMSVSSAFTSTLRATSSVFVPRAAGVRFLLFFIFPHACILHSVSRMLEIGTPFPSPSPRAVICSSARRRTVPFTARLPAVCVVAPCRFKYSAHDCVFHLIVCVQLNSPRASGCARQIFTCTTRFSHRLSARAFRAPPGTKVTYTKEQVIAMRSSPMSQSPLVLPQIPGVTSPMLAAVASKAAPSGSVWQS